MGFFKDVSTLNKMGKEIRKDYNPVAQMAQAQLSMQQGLPSEARRVAEQGFKSGALGTGAEAGRLWHELRRGRV